MQAIRFPRNLAVGFVATLSAVTMGLAGIAHADVAQSSTPVPDSASNTPASAPAFQLVGFPIGETVSLPSINGAPIQKFKMSEACQTGNSQRVIVGVTQTDEHGVITDDVQTLVLCKLNTETSTQINQIVHFTGPVGDDIPYYLVVNSHSAHADGMLPAKIEANMLNLAAKTGNIEPSIIIGPDNQPIVIGADPKLLVADPAYAPQIKETLAQASNTKVHPAVIYASENLADVPKPIAQAETMPPKQFFVGKSQAPVQSAASVVVQSNIAMTVDDIHVDAKTGFMEKPVTYALLSAAEEKLFPGEAYNKKPTKLRYHGVFKAAPKAAVAQVTPKEKASSAAQMIAADIARQKAQFLAENPGQPLPPKNAFIPVGVDATTLELGAQPKHLHQVLKGHKKPVPVKAPVKTSDKVVSAPAPVATASPAPVDTMSLVAWLKVMGMLAGGGPVIGASAPIIGKTSLISTALEKVSAVASAVLSQRASTAPLYNIGPHGEVVPDNTKDLRNLVNNEAIAAELTRVEAERLDPNDILGTVYDPRLEDHIMRERVAAASASLASARETLPVDDFDGIRVFGRRKPLDFSPAPEPIPASTEAVIPVASEVVPKTPTELVKQAWKDAAKAVRLRNKANKLEDADLRATVVAEQTQALQVAVATMKAHVAAFMKDDVWEGFKAARYIFNKSVPNDLDMLGVIAANMSGLEGAQKTRAMCFFVKNGGKRTDLAEDLQNVYDNVYDSAKRGKLKLKVVGGLDMLKIA